MFYLIGALAGVANGLFGAGGGMLLVPLFLKFGKLPQKQAFATSVAIILVFSSISVCTYFIRGDFLLSGGLPFIIGGFLGGLLSGKLFSKANTFWLCRILGIIIIYGGVRSLFLI